jgi:agmatine/peptidylarginine deiminase
MRVGFIVISLLLAAGFMYWFKTPEESTVETQRSGTAVEKFKPATDKDWLDTLLEQDSRVAAEWEPAIGVVISWRLHVPHTLLQAIAKDSDIYLMVESEVEKAEAQEKITAWGIPESRVKYYIQPQGYSAVNSRDWASFSTFNADGDFRFFDGEYIYPIADINNRITDWEGDEADPEGTAFAAIAKDLGLPRTDLGISLTGGNMFFDGLGTLFATELYTKENEEFGYSLKSLQTILKDSFSVNRYIEVSNYEASGIQHIDVLLMMLDQERLLVKRVPENHPSYERIEEIVKSLKTLSNPFARPYEILRIDTPVYEYKGEHLANYTNALILNKNVYVPLFDIPGDKEALATWRAAMPGYKVTGFEYTDEYLEYGWSYTDALHCRTKQIHDPEMLHMVHKHLNRIVVPANSYEITAYIRDYSEAGLASQATKVMWRLQGSDNWSEVTLNKTGREYIYIGHISGPFTGQTVEYYISATDNSGKSGTLPITAPVNLYKFYIGGSSVENN